MLPFVSCLCPTYRRPALLANSLACFLAQDYPADRRELLIVDDGGDFQDQEGPGWRLSSRPDRFRSLPDKYNSLANWAQGDYLVIWEDDDIYLPWHIRAHVRALESAATSKPSVVLSLYTGELLEEPGGGRFQASMAFTRAALRGVGGWPQTQRADFDLQLIQRLAHWGPVADPCVHDPPSYIFRWCSTQHYHGQCFMRTPDDDTWYARCEQPQQRSGGNNLTLVAAMDSETASAFVRSPDRAPALLSS